MHPPGSTGGPRTKGSCAPVEYRKPDEGRRVMAKQGITVTYETIRQWWNTAGTQAQRRTL